MKTISTRVVEFAKGLDSLCLDREQLILDIFAEVKKRKTPEAQWEYLMSDVAKPLAAHYKCEARYTRTGAISFYDGDDRHDTAYSRFRALVSSTGLVSGSGNTNKAQKKEVDLVAEALKLIKQMTPAQKKQVISALI